MKINDTRRALKDLLYVKVAGLVAAVSFSNDCHDPLGKFCSGASEMSDKDLAAHKAELQQHINSNPSSATGAARRRLSEVSAEQRNRASGSSSGPSSSPAKGSAPSPAKAGGSQFSEQERKDLMAARLKTAHAGTTFDESASARAPITGGVKGASGKVSTVAQLSDAMKTQVDRKLDGGYVQRGDGTFVVPNQSRGNQDKNERTGHGDLNFPTDTKHPAYRLEQMGAADLLLDSKGGSMKLEDMLREQRPLMVENPPPGRFGAGATNPIRYYELPGTKKLLLAAIVDKRNGVLSDAYITHADKGFSGLGGRREVRAEVENWRRAIGAGPIPNKLLSKEEL